MIPHLICMDRLQNLDSNPAYLWLQDARGTNDDMEYFHGLEAFIPKLAEFASLIDRRPINAMGCMPRKR